MLWQHSSLCFILMTYQRWQSQNRLFVQRFFLSCAGTIFLLLFALFLCSFDVFASKEKLFHTFVFDFFYFIPFYFCFFFPHFRRPAKRKNCVQCNFRFIMFNVYSRLLLNIRRSSTQLSTYLLFFFTFNHWTKRLTWMILHTCKQFFIPLHFECILSLRLLLIF